MFSAVFVLSTWTKFPAHPICSVGMYSILGPYVTDYIDTGNGTDSIGDLPRTEWIPSKEVDERIINPRALTVCRYYTAGNCRRGSSCHYMHPPLVSVQEGTATPAICFVYQAHIVLISHQSTLLLKNLTSIRCHNVKGGTTVMALRHSLRIQQPNMRDHNVSTCQKTFWTISAIFLRRTTLSTLQIRV